MNKRKRLLRHLALGRIGRGPLGSALGQFELNMGRGDFSFLGADAALVREYLLSVVGGDFSFAGQAAGLSKSGGTFILGAESGSFLFAGDSMTAVLDREILGSAGSFVVAGTDASLEFHREIVGGAASFTFTGSAATLTHASSTITWDSAKKAAAITLSNGDLTGSLGANTFYASMLGSGSGRSSGKFYFELTITAMNPDGQGVGFGNASADINGLPGFNDNNSVGWRNAGGVFLNHTLQATIQTFAQGDVLAIAVDLTAQLVWFRSSTSTNWNNSGAADPATGAGGISFSSINAGPYFPMTTLEINGDTFTANFGATSYALTPPSGFGNW